MTKFSSTAVSRRHKLLAVLIFMTASTLAVDASAGKHTRKQGKTAVSASVIPGPDYAQRLDALQAADDIALRRDLDPVWVRQTLGQARYVAAIAKAVTPPAVGVAKNWQLYRSRFVEPRAHPCRRCFLASPARHARARRACRPACPLKSSSASSAWRPFTVSRWAITGCWMRLPR